MELNRTKSGNILVVDDQPNNLKVISSVLNEEYNLSIANSGEKALKILEKIKPDLILLDIMMPDMDGYEVCKRIKLNKDLWEIPIIFLTAKTDIEDIIKGFDYGAVDYITKPFNIKEVKVRIKNHLNLAFAKNTIIHQKTKLEEYTLQLEQTQIELEKRNEDLVIAHDAVEEHASRIVKMNQVLMESEYNLKEMNKELIKSNSEKDKFFSIIAHDLKSPFSGLLGLLEMLVNNESDFSEDDRRDVISSLYFSAKNVYSLINNLLEWSRMQQNSIQFVPIETYVSEFLTPVIELSELKAKEKNIKILNKIPENTRVTVDAMMAATVFRNLISNAIKFSNEGTTITLEAEDINDKYYEFCVVDEGVGIDEIIKNKLFRIDEHITNIGTHNESGTGLGLILCKEFINKHGGEIGVESEVDKGARFYFTLPK